jgi:hypothetical protein
VAAIKGKIKVAGVAVRVPKILHRKLKILSVVQKVGRSAILNVLKSY